MAYKYKQHEKHKIIAIKIFHLKPVLSHHIKSKLLTIIKSRSILTFPCIVRRDGVWRTLGGGVPEEGGATTEKALRQVLISLTLYIV